MNVAENVPLLILLAMEASVSFIPHPLGEFAVSNVCPLQFGLQEPLGAFLPRQGFRGLA